MEKDKLYFDIGSHLGYWSLKNLVNVDKIVAVEASNITYKLLQTNLAHKSDQIIKLNYAVGDFNLPFINFYQADNMLLSTTNLDWITNPSNRFYQTSFEVIKAPTITLDTLIKEYGVPELIKIDVEGGELECLKSLTQKTPMITFEWASETKESTFQCLSYLQQLGYTDFYIQYGDDFLFRPTEFYDISNCLRIINGSKEKKDWGMIWVK